MDNVLLLPKKADVFGTDLMLLGRAYPNKAETGP
jgi:hypothetical protein